MQANNYDSFCTLFTQNMKTIIKGTPSCERHYVINYRIYKRQRKEILLKYQISSRGREDAIRGGREDAINQSRPMSSVDWYPFCGVYTWNSTLVNIPDFHPIS